MKEHLTNIAIGTVVLAIIAGAVSLIVLSETTLVFIAAAFFIGFGLGVAWAIGVWVREMWAMRQEDRYADRAEWP
jgi:preprotein translocase subunit SecF